MMKSILQRAIQVSLLILFLLFMILGKAQLWMGLLVFGILASFLFGRFYCGWICSINTALSGVNWIKRKFKIKSLPIPALLLKPWVRAMAFALFLAAFAMTVVTGQRLPVLPVLFFLGILLTFLFPEELWHRHLCPYGTLLKGSSFKASKGMQVDADLCNNCGACKRVCPAKAVVKTEGKHQILKPDCLVCFQCKSSCRQNAISYQ